MFVQYKIMVKSGPRAAVSVWCVCPCVLTTIQLWNEMTFDLYTLYLTRFTLTLSTSCLHVKVTLFIK